VGVINSVLFSTAPTYGRMTASGKRPRDNPISGAFYLLEGVALLNRPGIRAYVAVPLLVNVLLFGGALIWGWGQLERLGVAVEHWLPDSLDFLSVLLIPLFFAAGIVFVLFFFALIANFIAAPFNGLLADAVERHLRAAAGDSYTESPPPSWSVVVRDLHRSIASELRKLVYFVPRALAIGLLYLIPVLNITAPFVWLAFSAWMLAISYADFPMGNHGLGFREQRIELRRWRLTSLGFGAITTFAVLIPIVNLIVIPASVAGATKLWVERIEPYRRH